MDKQLSVVMGYGKKYDLAAVRTAMIAAIDLVLEATASEMLTDWRTRFAPMLREHFEKIAEDFDVANAASPVVGGEVTIHAYPMGLDTLVLNRTLGVFVQTSGQLLSAIDSEPVMLIGAPVPGSYYLQPGHSLDAAKALALKIAHSDNRLKARLVANAGETPEDGQVDLNALTYCLEVRFPHEHFGDGEGDLRLCWSGLTTGTEPPGRPQVEG